MKSILFVVIFLLASVCFVNAQTSGSGPPEQGSIPAKGSAKDNSSKSSAGTTSQSTPATNDYVRPDSKTRFRRYIKSMVGPVSLGKTVLSSGYATWKNSPEEWGDNWEGFGRRVASSLGKKAIKQTTMYALEETLKYDSRFYRSKDKSFGSRLGNALISPVTARNANGKRVIGIPRIVGTYTSSIVAAEAWYPSRYDYKDGLKSGTVSLGMNAAFNVVKEFIWKK